MRLSTYCLQDILDLGNIYLWVWVNSGSLSQLRNKSSGRVFLGTAGEGEAEQAAGPTKGFTDRAASGWGVAHIFLRVMKSEDDPEDGENMLGDPS